MWEKLRCSSLNSGLDPSLECLETSDLPHFLSNNGFKIRMNRLEQKQKMLSKQLNVLCSLHLIILAQKH